MENIFQKIIYSIIILPLIGVLIYSIKEPEKSYLFGRRWQYKNDDLEPREGLVKLNKILSIIFLIVIVIGYLAFLLL